MGESDQGGESAMGEEAVTSEEASRAAGKLEAYRALLHNSAWTQDILPLISKFQAESADGLSARNRTPVERAEWLEGYHFASMLLRHVPDRIAQLESELREWQAAQADLPIGIAEML